MARIDRPHNPVTRARRQRSYKQCLQRPVYAGSLRPDGDPVLHEAEDEEDYYCDGDRHEQGMRNALHGKVWDHRYQTAFVVACQQSARFRTERVQTHR